MAGPSWRRCYGSEPQPPRLSLSHLCLCHAPLASAHRSPLSWRRSYSASILHPSYTHPAPSPQDSSRLQGHEWALPRLSLVTHCTSPCVIHPASAPLPHRRSSGRTSRTCRAITNSCSGCCDGVPLGVGDVAQGRLLLLIPGASQGCREAFTDCEPKTPTLGSECVDKERRVPCLTPISSVFSSRARSTSASSTSVHMVRRGGYNQAQSDWIFSGESARQLISGDGAVASRPQPAALHTQPVGRPAVAQRSGDGLAHADSEARAYGMSGRQRSPERRNSKELMSTMRDGAVVVDKPRPAPIEDSEQRTPRASMETMRPEQDYEPALRESPRQTRYEDAYGEDGLGARHRCTEDASAEHGGQDGRRWEPASREHGFGRPAVAQRSGDGLAHADDEARAYGMSGRQRSPERRNSKELMSTREVVRTDQDKIFDRKRSVHHPRNGSPPVLLSQRQQQQLAAVNRSPRATQESMPTEAAWQQEQQSAAVTRERRASKELMSTERSLRLSGLKITTEDYGYTERHQSPRQKHYNAMARLDAQQAKQFGLQATPFGLQTCRDQTARDHMEGRPSEAHYDPQHPGQPRTARASHDKREDDAGRCAAPPPHLGRLVAAVAAAGCPRAQETTHTHAHPCAPTLPSAHPPSRPPSHLTAAGRALPPPAPLAHLRPGVSTGSSNATGARGRARAAMATARRGMAMARRVTTPAAARWSITPPRRRGPPAPTWLTLTTASHMPTARRVLTACQGVSGARSGAALSSCWAARASVSGQRPCAWHATRRGTRRGTRCGMGRGRKQGVRRGTRRGAGRGAG